LNFWPQTRSAWQFNLFKMKNLKKWPLAQNLHIDYKV